jgi:hypothetical protein
MNCDRAGPVIRGMGEHRRREPDEPWRAAPVRHARPAEDAIEGSGRHTLVPNRRPHDAPARDAFPHGPGGWSDGARQGSPRTPPRGAALPPAPGPPIRGNPGPDFPARGTAGHGLPARGGPGSGHPAPGTPGRGFPTDGTAGHRTTAHDAAINWTPGHGIPAQGTAGRGLPAQGPAIHWTPGNGIPATGAGPAAVRPARGSAPGFGAPDDGVPRAPIQGAPPARAAIRQPPPRAVAAESGPIRIGPQTPGRGMAPPREVRDPEPAAEPVLATVGAPAPDAAPDPPKSRRIAPAVFTVLSLALAPLVVALAVLLLPAGASNNADNRPVIQVLPRPTATVNPTPAGETTDDPGTTTLP